MGSDRPMLLCRVGRCVVALPIEHVAETMRVLPIDSHKDVLPFVLGLSLIRGAATPVLSGAKLLGAAGDEPSRFVLLRTGEKQVALAVDAVIGLRASDDRAFHALPPLIEAAAAETVATIGTHDGALLVVLESARIVSSGERGEP
jgi:purine-binding chemotaxis protein CheW